MTFSSNEKGLRYIFGWTSENLELSLTLAIANSLYVNVIACSHIYVVIK